jgi:hypothetical protein
VTPSEGTDLARQLRAHRKDPRYFPSELAEYIGERMQAWRDDPTAQGLTFDAWLASTPQHPPAIKPLALEVRKLYQ